jgi:hypothetical protein
MMAGEGDRGISGDFFEIRNAADNAWVRLNHGGNSQNNYFNSSIFTGGNSRNPTLLNNSGMDVSTYTIEQPIQQRCGEWSRQLPPSGMVPLRTPI